MDELGIAIISTLTSIVDLFGEKEIIGLLIGALGTAGWYKLTSSAEQRRKNKQVLAAVTADVEEVFRIATENVGIVHNEKSRISEGKFTMNPPFEFNSTSADLLLLLAEIKGGKPIELWRSLKKIEALSGQASRISAESMRIRRAIKMEDRTHIYLFELMPFLRTYNDLCLGVLLQILVECEKSKELIKDLVK